jgi:hypothetical protein
MQTSRVGVIGAILLAHAGAQAQAQPAPADVPPVPAAPPSIPAPAAEPSPAGAPAPEAAKPDEELDPFTFADFTWQSGNARTKDSVLGNKYFTGEFRLDDVFHYSLNRPQDDTIGGSTEAWRHAENQVTQLGIGGDFHWDNVQGRMMTQFGQLSTTTPRNDPSTGRGQWQLDNAYRYLSEAYGGYHFGDPHRGVNLQAGIFMSYIGLWSYYNFDNWTYQPSYVSSNTPWFFNGVRLQWFPSDKLKIEPWLINGWQSYARFNNIPGVGGQIRYTPSGDLIFIFNQYLIGSDVLGNPDRHRFHTDDSIQVKWYEDQSKPVSKLASTLTVDAGCEYGGGVSCMSSDAGGPAQYFIGFMAYLRAWFDHDKYALTFGGGAIKNPGRYLVLLPPINGATALSGTPYFTENPGDPFVAWDTQLTFDYMPSQYITLRGEFTYRHASVPYFSGSGGITPPGGNQGAPGSTVMNSDGTTWKPDLVNNEPRFTLALLVKL